MANYTSKVSVTFSEDDLLCVSLGLKIANHTMADRNDPRVGVRERIEKLRRDLEDKLQLILSL